MSYSLFFKVEANNDLNESAQWYEQQKRGLGEEFLNYVFAECNYLKEFPNAFPVKYNETRELVLKKFPFIIVYKIEGNNIYVIAVFHTSQSLKRKRKRLKK